MQDVSAYFVRQAQFFKKKVPDSLQWARFDDVIF
jgi:hypothetical protein